MLAAEGWREYGESVFSGDRLPALQIEKSHENGRWCQSHVTEILK